MKKLVIFDLDGTLLNTIADLAHSTNHALRQNGFPTHDVKEYNFFVGNGINKLFERALPEVSEVTNLSRMTRTYREALLDVFPRISLQLLDTKRHLTLVTVQSQDYGLDLVANLHEVLSGTQVLCPRHL